MQALRETIYSFKAKWFDTHAQLNRHYSVRYFVDSHNVEIFDTKTNKLFLKKSACPAVLAPQDFFLGAKVLLYGRHFELQEYLDPFTSEQLGKQQQRSILVVKRDMVAHIGAVLTFLQHQQFSLAALKMLLVSRTHAEQLLAFHKATTAFETLVDDLTARPVVAIEVLASSCLDKLQHVVSILSARFNARTNDFEASTTVLDAQRQREFFFETLHRPTATFQNCTCCVVLPHILKDGHAGDVVEAIQEHSADVMITAIELFTLDRTTAAEFLEVYEGVVPHFNETVDHFTTGPCLALELIGRNAESVVAKFRDHAGPWDVEMAKELRPATIRARYGHDRVRNAVHCTDLADDGALESEYFFEILSKRQLKNIGK